MSESEREYDEETRNSGTSESQLLKASLAKAVVGRLMRIVVLRVMEAPLEVTQWKACGYPLLVKMVAQILCLLLEFLAPRMLLLMADPLNMGTCFLLPYLVGHIVTETKRYAEQQVRDHQQHLLDSLQSRIHKWIRQGQTSDEEIRAFLGIVLNMGLVQKPNLQPYWDSLHKSQAIPWFLEHFSQDRFQLLLKFLHFSDNSNMPDQQDPNFESYKIQLLIDHFQKKFLHHYHPHQDISIDENMIGYKGNTPHLCQFMPNKPHARFGIELLCLSDSTNKYFCRFEVCKGAHSPGCAANLHGATYSLVMCLLHIQII